MSSCEHQQVHSVRLEGALVLGSDTLHALRGVRRMVSRGARIEIDLAGVEKIDAAGIGTLASLCESAREDHAVVEVLNSPRRITRRFEVCGLAGILSGHGYRSPTSASSASKSSRPRSHDSRGSIGKVTTFNEFSRASSRSALTVSGA